VHGGGLTPLLSCTWVAPGVGERPSEGEPLLEGLNPTPGALIARLGRRWRAKLYKLSSLVRTWRTSQQLSCKDEHHPISAGSGVTEAREQR
jgi:hypothetical protein